MKYSDDYITAKGKAMIIERFRRAMNLKGYKEVATMLKKEIV